MVKEIPQSFETNEEETKEQEEFTPEKLEIGKVIERNWLSPEDFRDINIWERRVRDGEISKEDFAKRIKSRIELKRKIDKLIREKGDQVEEKDINELWNWYKSISEGDELIGDKEKIKKRIETRQREIKIEKEKEEKKGEEEEKGEELIEKIKKLRVNPIPEFEKRFKNIRSGYQLSEKDIEELKQHLLARVKEQVSNRADIIEYDMNSIFKEHPLELRLYGGIIEKKEDKAVRPGWEKMKVIDYLRRYMDVGEGTDLEKYI